MAIASEHMKIFAGTSSFDLGKNICEFLDVPLGVRRVERFSDGEMFIEIGENVRGVDVFVVQSTSNPASDNLMELLITIDALKRASARTICAVIPYYGYARQDRKVSPRTPITAKLVADLVTAAGATRVLSIDLHAGQIQGFFDIPFDHLFAMPVLLKDMQIRYGCNPDDTVIVSPDAGGTERARAYAKRLQCGIAIIDKRRPKANIAEIMHVVGDIEGKDCVLVDDMVDTAGTLTAGAQALKDQGARSIVAFASHGVLSGPAISRLSDSPIEQLVITDTIASSTEVKKCTKISTLTVAPLLARAIRRIYLGESVSSLFV